MLGILRTCLITLAGGVLLPVSGVGQLYPAGRIDEQQLFCNGQKAYVRAYDLSPNGKTVAILATPLALFARHAAPSCLAIWDIASGRVTQSSSVTVNDSLPGSGFSPQVLFVRDGKELILQNQDTLSIYRASDLTRERVIGPPKGALHIPLQVLYASKADLLLISFGTPRANQTYLEPWENISEIVDPRTGDVHGTWTLDDRPLAFSPDGKWAVVSDRSSSSGALGISFVDLSSGHTVRLKHPHLGFAANGDAFGRLIATFLDKGRILVTPDGNFDKKGENAGHEIRVISVPDGLVIEEIKPPHYGPMGQLAVSGSGTLFAALSQFVSPWDMTHHIRLPRSAEPNLLIIKRDGSSFKTTASIPLKGRLVLRENRTFDSALLRLSDDGHTISLVQDYGVHVYKLK